MFLTYVYFLLFALQYRVVVGSRCFFDNPKPGDVHPFVELEVITKEQYPPKNGSHITIRCKATAPVDNTQSYNPVLLNPTVINFFFNNKRLSVDNCAPSSSSSQKICELDIPNFRQEHKGKYYCMARNGYRCTAIGGNVPVNPCPAPGEKEKQALNSYHNNLMKMAKCLKDFTLCCITGSNCNESYQRCLQIS